MYQYVQRSVSHFGGPFARLQSRLTGQTKARAWRGAAALWLSLILTTPLALVSPAAQAREMAPNDSFLTVDIPGEIERKVREEKTLLGEVRTVTVAGSKGDAAMGIAVSKLPKASQTLATDGMIYRSARRKLLRRYDADRTTWENCRHAGMPCRLLEYEADDGRHGLARFYLTEDMMVIVNGIYETDRRLVVAYHDSTSRN